MANPNDITILTNQSMASSFQSAPILVIRNVAFSFQVTYTGSPVGTFSIQTSSDTAEMPQSTLPTNWSTLTPIAPSPASVPDNASPMMMPYNKGAQLPWNWIRLVYT